MSDLSPFYTSARAQRERSIDAQAGDEAWALYGPQQAEVAPGDVQPAGDGEVKVETDVSKIDTSKVPGQRPRTGPAPEPKGGLKVEGAPQPSSKRQGPPEESPEAEAAVERRVPHSDALNVLTRYIANTEDPESFRKQMIESFQKDPRDFEAGLQQLLTGLGLSMPFVNAAMRATKEELEAAGAPNWAATAGEYIAGALVPSRVAIGMVGRNARPAAQFGAAAVNRAEQTASAVRQAGQAQGEGSAALGRLLAGDLETGGGFSYSVKGARKVEYPEGTLGVSIAPEFERSFPGKARPEDIATYVEEQRKVLTDPRAALGGWYDPKTDRTHLDISVAAKREEANALGASVGQRAIFDPKTGESVPVAYGSGGPHPYSAPAEPLKPQDVVTAQAYDTARSNPALKPQWDALAVETEKLYVEISKTVKIEPVPGQPYASADQMAREVQETGVLKVSTDNNTHPFWSPEQNLRFRAVHDYFGHIGTGNDFSLEGEYRAWLAHETKISDEAAKTALKTEVYGQAASAIANSGRFSEQKAVDLGKGLPPIEERLARGQDLTARPTTKAAPGGPQAFVEAAGARFDGVSDIGGGKQGVWFTDPKTGSTLLMKLDEATPENIALHLAESRKAWGIAGQSGVAAAGAAAGLALQDEQDPYAGTAVGAAVGIGTGNLKLLRGLKPESLVKLPVGSKLFNALAADGAAQMARGGLAAWGKRMEAYGVPPEHLHTLMTRSKEIASNGLKQLRKDLATFEDLLPLWEKAEGRPDWYSAPAVLKQGFGPDTNLMAGLLAALSPGRGAADVNIDAAFQVYRILKTEEKHDWKRLVSELKPGGEFGLKSQLPNVWRAIDGQPLNGNKVHDFHLGLLGDESVFPIDRHGARFLAPDSITIRGEINDAQYTLLSDWGKQFAQNVGKTPRYTQQRLWIGERMTRELEDIGNEPFFETTLQRAKDQGILDLVPKSSLIDEAGRGRAAGAWMIGAVGAGALTGAYTGDTLEEQVQNGLNTAGILSSPAIVKKLSSWLTKSAPAARNLVRKPTGQYPPEIGARIEKLFSSYEADLSAFTRGHRPHSVAWEQAEQMIRDGRMDLWSIKQQFPGQTMNDSEAMALVKTVADHLDETRAFTKGLLSAIDAGKPLSPEQIEQFLGRLYEARELLPPPRGVVAEAGRTLSAMNEPTKGYNNYLAQWQLLFSDPEKGISPERLISAISRFESVEQHLGLARASQQPGFADMAIEALYGVLLGPLSLVVNGASGLLGLAYMPVERTGMALVGGVERLIGADARTVTHWAEPFAAIYGYATALPMAFKNAKQAFLTGERAIGGGIPKVESLQTGPISGITSQWLESTLIGKLAETSVPLAVGGALYASGTDPVYAAGAALSLHPRSWPLIPRGMAATDELVKTMLFEAGKWSIAVRRASAAPARLREQVLRETVQNPNSLVRAEAERLANEFTFNAPSPAVQKINEWAQEIPGPYRVLVKTVVPFLNVPVNLVKFTAQRTLGLQQLHASWWSDISSPGTARGDKAIAQLGLGAAWLASINKLAADGVLVGSGPADPNQLREWLADGNQEYAVRFGNKSFSINRMDPWGQMVSIIADWSAISAHIDDASNDQIAAALLMVVSKDMMSKSYLEGAANVLDAVTNRDPNKAYHWLHQYTGTGVPALVKQFRRIEDPHLREVRDLLDAAMNKVPEFSKKLSPRKNIFADPIASHEPIGYGVDFVNPFPMKTIKNDPAARAVLDNKISVSMPAWQIYGDPAKNWTIDPQRESVGVPLTHRMRDELIDLVGKPLKREWLAYVQSPAYDKENEGPDSANTLVFRRLHKEFSRAAVATLIDRHPELLRGLEEKLARRASALTTPQGPTAPASHTPSMLQRLQAPAIGVTP